MKNNISLDKRIFEIVLFSGITFLGFLYSLSSLKNFHFLPFFYALLSIIFFLLHLYLFNDWADFDKDLIDPLKKNRISIKWGKKKTLIFSIIFAIFFVLFSFLNGKKIFILSIILLFVSFLYSFPKIHLKSKPFASYPIHIIGASGYFLLGYFVNNNNLSEILSFCIFLSIIYIAGEINQELRDFETDKQMNVFTTPHLLGKKLSFFIENALFLLSIIPFYFIVIIFQLPIILFYLYLFIIVFFIVFALKYGSNNRYERMVFIKIKKVYHTIFSIIGMVLIIMKILILLK